MRHTNWRMVIGGLVFLVFAVGFFFFMSLNASISTDPAELMRIVGGVSGTVGGISVVMILVGLIGKKA